MKSTSPRLKILFICLSMGLIHSAHEIAAQPADELVPLKYNNPGLVVDLGVGLWAWPIPCDADGDGDYDLIVSCPDKPSNGIWLFENATGDTALNAMPVFRPARFLSRTVHYVMPSYDDTVMRVLSPGTEYLNFTQTGTQTSNRLPIPPNFHKPVGTQPKGPKVRHNQWRYADYNGDGRLDLIVGIEDWSNYGWDDAWDRDGNWINGPLHGWIYVFLNSGSSDQPRYESPFLIESDGRRLEVFGCPSPNFADFDGDGDLDLLCGEFLDGFTYFENLGTRTEPRYGPGIRLTGSDGHPLAMDLQMIVPVAFDWDRDGDTDLIVGDEDGRVAFLENVTPRRVTREGNTPGASESGPVHGPPVFHPPRYFQQEADTLKCGALATPVGVDWDQDGDIDIVCGNTAGYIEIFENLSGPNVAEPRWAAPRRLIADNEVFRIMAGPNGSIQGPAEAKWGYTTFSVADWDGDGLPDIVFNSILSEVMWLRNIGTPGSPSFGRPQPIDVEWESDQPELAWGWLRPKGKGLLTQWRTTPFVYDINRDSLPDLVMLDQDGYLAFFERAMAGDQRILKAPQRIFIDEQGEPLRLNSGTAGRSGRRKLCIADWNGDGRFDLLLNSANADLMLQTGTRDGKFVMKNVGALATRNIEGHDVSPTVVDFDGDGVPDFLGGAEDGRLYFLKHGAGK